MNEITPLEDRFEELREKNKEKKVFFFVDREKGIDQKSKEILLKKNIEIHYPIGFDGGMKYSRIRKIQYAGFRGNLPSGVGKSPNRGYGFTKVMKPFIDFIENRFPDIEIISLVKNGRSYIDDVEGIFQISSKDFESLYLVLKYQLNVQKQERLNKVTEKLNEIFPKKIKKPDKVYIKDSAYYALSAWQQSISEFSENDKSAIKDLFDKLSLTNEFFTADSLLKTKQVLEERYIDDVIDSYKKLMLQATETATLEKKWQSLLKSHSWIFTFIFSFPVILMDDEAYVGGKNLSNRNGKVTDFLVKNNLSNNVAFIEIKTHKTELLKKGKAYRGNDVFPLSSDLSGAIAQVLVQRDTFQKAFALMRLNSPDQSFETFNSKCVVLVGSISDLTPNQIKSFELTRSNSRDVEIITFDELLERFNGIRDLMKGSI
ncbi:MAG: Shedu immune nuclease family protein [Bacteroidota bacterium]